jgi:predicted Zn-dependent protease
MNQGTMNTDNKTTVMAIQLKRSFGFKRVEGVWVIEQERWERVTLDGTTYTMSGNITAVHERVTFDKAVTKTSKLITQAVKMLADKYPTAKVEII